MHCARDVSRCTGVHDVRTLWYSLYTMLAVVGIQCTHDVRCRTVCTRRTLLHSVYTTYHVVERVQDVPVVQYTAYTTYPAETARTAGGVKRARPLDADVDVTSGHRLQLVRRPAADVQHTVVLHPQLQRTDHIWTRRHETTANPPRRPPAPRARLSTLYDTVYPPPGDELRLVSTGSGTTSISSRRQQDSKKVSRLSLTVTLCSLCESIIIQYRKQIFTHNEVASIQLRGGAHPPRVVDSLRRESRAAVSFHEARLDQMSHDGRLLKVNVTNA